MKLPRESTPATDTTQCQSSNFLAQSAAGATVATTLTAAATSKAAKASDRIRIGFIGPGGRGFGTCENACETSQRVQTLTFIAVVKSISAGR